jgi:hypothetical protein
LAQSPALLNLFWLLNLPPDARGRSTLHARSSQHSEQDQVYDQENLSAYNRGRIVEVANLLTRMTLGYSRVFPDHYRISIQIDRGGETMG